MLMTDVPSLSTLRRMKRRGDYTYKGATWFIAATDGLKKDWPPNFYGFIPTINNHRKTGYWIRVKGVNGNRHFWRPDIPIYVKRLDIVESWLGGMKPVGLP